MARRTDERPRALHRLGLAMLLVVLVPGPAVVWAQNDSGSSAQGTSSERPKTGDLDRLALASLLIGDGNYGRAASVLAEVDTAREDLDRVRFRTLRGLVRLNRDNPKGAKADFRAAIQAGQDRPVIYVYLAQALFQLQEYRAALAAIDNAGAAATKYPSLYLLQAEAHWKLDQPVGAFRALETGAARFPERPGFLRRQVFYLMELGTYQTAAELGREYLERIDGTARDYLAIAMAMHRGGQSRKALVFLERAHLRFPGNARLTQALAQIYFERGQKVAAANLYEQAAAVHPELTHEAAEFNRRAGNLFRALYLNARVRDPKEKMRQRVAILLELERYAQVAAAEAALNRAGLLQDQNIRYALAYAYFKEGRFRAAERHLEQLTEGELVRQATQLRQYMQECRSDPWLCA